MFFDERRKVRGGTVGEWLVYNETRCDSVRVAGGGRIKARKAQMGERIMTRRKASEEALTLAAQSSTRSNERNVLRAQAHRRRKHRPTRDLEFNSRPCRCGTSRRALDRSDSEPEGCLRWCQRVDLRLCYDLEAVADLVGDHFVLGATHGSMQEARSSASNS